MPWSDESAARSALSCLADLAAGRVDPAVDSVFATAPNRSGLAAWLLAHDLGPVAFAQSRDTDPELAGMLRAETLGAAAGNLAHHETLLRIESCFEAEGIAMVLLKGASIAYRAYADPAFRPMTDVDIWVRNDDMPRAAACLRVLGFHQGIGLPDRPAELQRRSEGELVFRHVRRAYGLVELHYGAFPGWWIQRTAVPRSESVWNRAEPIGPGRHARQLSAEDAILQTAFHVVVNQFGQAPLRGLMDIAVVARTHRVDWDAVVERAKAWRLRTATWLALDSANRLFGVPGCGAAIPLLRPRTQRRVALRAFVTPRALLSGRDLTRTTRRHLFMLAIVDRSRDGARLIGRTLWPETWWIAARYGRRVSRVEHLRRLVRGRAV